MVFCHTTEEAKAPKSETGGLDPMGGSSGVDSRALALIELPRSATGSSDPMPKSETGGLDPMGGSSAVASRALALIEPPFSATGGSDPMDNAIGGSDPMGSSSRILLLALARQIFDDGAIMVTHPQNAKIYYNQSNGYFCIFRHGPLGDLDCLER